MHGIGNETARTKRLFATVVGQNEMIDPITKPRSGFLQQTVSQSLDGFAALTKPVHNLIDHCGSNWLRLPSKLI
jgi:hypothetical protein